MLFCHVSLLKKQHRVRRAPPSHPRGTYTVWSPLTRTARIQVHIQTLLNITRLSHNKQQPRARPRATVAHRNSGTLDVTAHDRGHVRSSAHDIPPSEPTSARNASEPIPQPIQNHGSVNGFSPWSGMQSTASRSHTRRCWSQLSWQSGALQSVKHASSGSTLASKLPGWGTGISSAKRRYQALPASFGTPITVSDQPAVRDVHQAAHLPRRARLFLGKPRLIAPYIIIPR
jgi:hypothetical protein